MLSLAIPSRFCARGDVTNGAMIRWYSVAPVILTLVTRTGTYTSSVTYPPSLNAIQADKN